MDVQTKYGELAKDDQFLRRGDVYQVLKDHPITQQILAGEITIGYAADELGYSRTAVTRSIAAIVVDIRGEQGGDLEGQAITDFLGPSDIALPDPDTPEYEQFLDELVTAFLKFRDTYFEVKRKVPFVNKVYHVTWIRATLHAILTGSHQLILSPPRHGKSELMIHFCVWLIIRNPDIRIMWVARNDDMAKQMVGSVKDHLEHNEKLCADFLGQERNYKTPGKWAALDFTVNTRTVVGMKSYTMVGVGWTGTILSRDCDFIVLDDVEDDRTVKTPGERQHTREKFAITLDSRIEDHTAVLIIGSRQHPDDLYGYLIENSAWHAIVNQAHDDACEINPHDLDAHTTCMLWHERHPYSWWYSKWQSQKEMGLEHLFEMVWQNRPRPSGLIVFRKEALLDARNFKRNIGDTEWFGKLEKPILLHNQVAGMDPAAVGQQAYWIWIYDSVGHRAYMLDAAIDMGGGLDKYADYMKAWKKKYDLMWWVTERNNIQQVFTTDSKIREIQGELGIALDSMQTGSNKHDLEFGLPGMARWFEEGMIDLPYGDEASRQMTDIYIRQALGYEIDDAGKARNRGKSDLLMSAWFPFKELLQWSYSELSDVQTTYEPAFAGYGSVSVGDGMPW